jgi:hypothetical protein
MLRGRVPGGHPWALGTVQGGGRRCIIDRTSWLYTQKSNRIKDAHGIAWSVPDGTCIPSMGVDETARIFSGQKIVNQNWVDVIANMTDMSRHVFTDQVNVVEFDDHITCLGMSNDIIGTLISFSVDFVYPNTCIKRFGRDTIIYETVTPLEYEKTLLMWCVTHPLRPAVDSQFRNTIETMNRPSKKHFQCKIIDHLGKMVVDDLSNTFVLL